MAKAAWNRQLQMEECSNSEIEFMQRPIPARDI